MLKLYSWNVNGIRAVLKKGNFQEFINNENPDIICLQEIKAKEEQVNLFGLESEIPKINDYNFYFNSADKAGYSGTAIISKIKPIKIMRGFPDDILEKFDDATDKYGDPNTEGRVTVAEFKDYFVATVYTPNSKSDLSRLSLRENFWDKAWLEYMKKLNKIKPVLFCGDLNVAHKEIDLANPKSNVGKHGFTNEERQGFDNFIDAGFVDTFRKFNQNPENYSWWSHFAKSRERNVGWRIDYWLASKDIEDKIVDAKIHPKQMGSDHCPVSIELKD